MRRKSAWILLAVLAVLLAVWMVSCSQRAKKSPGGTEVQEEESQLQEGREVDGAAQMAPRDETGQDRLAGGSSGELTYAVQRIEREYQADDGTPIFLAKLSWPAFDGEGEGIEAINRYFESWAQDKLTEYADAQNSTRQAALEVYRESRNLSWTGPWGESYEVEAVRTHGDYVSVLMASFLEEGSAHGLPYREDHLFRMSDGKSVGICEMTGKDQEEWNRLLRERFSQAVMEGDRSLYYDNALETLRTYDMRKAGYYFTDTGIVFYLAPYEIAPYSSGYVEISVSYEEAGA
ncbi:MAG TPA: RsiV family protein [Candidatus Eisenbergiella pullicola]|nr:RsiV family protein [Candidatus Eisenbergiella pullicola]